MNRNTDNIWLHRFAVLTALATFALIGIGGLVTSHGAGMSVPDWPTSYGYNMFLFPISKWWHGGNVFYEHSHRLFASGVGLLTTILAVWLWVKEARAWLRWFGVAAFFAVVVQGVLGGLRVTLFKDELGIFHATLAQLFFVLVCSIALFTSRWWKNLPPPLTPLPSDGRGEQDSNGLRKLKSLFVLATVLILAQLILGATMRHQHAGLAIPDFPLAYGKIWPAMDAQAVARYNQQRQETTETHPITATQIVLQMAHRIMAVLILICVGLAVWKARRWSAGHCLGSQASAPMPAPSWISALLRRLTLVWLGLILLQATLGALTVLKNKPADIATFHVLFGAVSLMMGAMLVLISSRILAAGAEITKK